MVDLTIPPPSTGSMSKRRTPPWAPYDAGYGSALLARQVGQKFAREIFFLADDVGQNMHGVGASTRRPRRAGVHQPWSGPEDHRIPRPCACSYAFNLSQDERRGGPAGLRRRATAHGLHDGRGRGGPRRLPAEAEPDWSTFRTTSEPPREPHGPSPPTDDAVPAHPLTAPRAAELPSDVVVLDGPVEGDPTVVAAPIAGGAVPAGARGGRGHLRSTDARRRPCSAPRRSRPPGARPSARPPGPASGCWAFPRTTWPGCRSARSLCPRGHHPRWS
ncbi:hypothetical protein QJS66_19055 [Kocuria rhizophila]|nr:hypothetical protein QJS66_19055 [Kocuria rhizophila]